MPVPQMDYGETLPQYYRRLFDLVRRMDPKAILGACSPNEIERMKGRFVQLETEATERARGPFDREKAELSGLSRRFDEARSKVAWLQAELKARVSPELTILVTPEDLEAPASIAEYEASIAVLTPRVASLEAMGQRLNSYLVEWPRLSPEQQNRKLILALAERK
jgi:hypothetical protein